MEQVLYLISGCLLGLVIQKGTELKARKQRLNHRIEKINSQMESPQVKQSDEVLESIRSLNHNLQSELKK